MNVDMEMHAGSQLSTAWNRRRWAPKVKTGCMTCRIRRVKCDEGKPLCQRCISSGRKCDGYVDARWPRRGSQPQLAPLVPIAPAIFTGSAESNDIILLTSNLLAAQMPVSNVGVKCISDNLSEFILSPSEQLLSYGLHLPCRLGYNAALNSAVKCVIAAFHWANSPNAFQSASTFKALSLYAHALQCLQQALYHSEYALLAETLCATELLSIFEHLTRDDKYAWIQHARGAARLIQHRGPRRFVTDFEKSLLMNQVGIIVNEAFFDGKHCFLEQDAWMSVLRSTISPICHISGCSEILVSFYEILIPLAGLMADCSAIIINQEPNKDGDREHRARHEVLLEESDKIRNSLLLWYNQWKYDLANSIQTYNGFSQEVVKDNSLRKRLEIFVIYQACTLLCNRLYVALDGDQAYTVERQSRELAVAMINSRKARRISMQECNITLSLAASQAIITTAEDWDMANDFSSNSTTQRARNLIAAATFYRWIGAMGMCFVPGRSP